MAWTLEYKKNYHREYYLKTRVLKGRSKNVIYSAVNCIVCKQETKRTSTRQKVCILCKPEYMRNHRLNWFRNKYKTDLNFRKRRQELTTKNRAIWLEKNIDKERLRKRLSEASRKTIGKVDIKMFQMIYEDNIKKYGTLTCILCLKSIQIGEDSLEHKLPISRGGKNNYENLAISHLLCNMKKHTMNVEEYKEYAGIF